MATEFSRAGSASLNVCGGQTFCGTEQKEDNRTLITLSGRTLTVDASGLLAYVLMIDRIIHIDAVGRTIHYIHHSPYFTPL
jgi:hypothetical protein